MWVVRQKVGQMANKPFSYEPYFVVGLQFAYNSRKYSETRFSTELGAMRHARRLARTLGMERRAVVFVDKVDVMGVHTRHREEEGTNRRPWLSIARGGIVWLHDGIGGWDQVTALWA